MKQRLKTIEFLKFFIINLIIVTVFIILYLHNFHGDEKGFAFEIVFISIFIATPIIVIQYPILNLRNNWIYKSFIYYLSMLTFLFFLGVIFSWNEKVGSNEAGSLLARLDGGFRFIVYGQLFGGLLAFVPILLINFFLRNKIFLKKEKRT